MSIYEPLAERDGHRVLQLRSPVDLKPTGELVCANRADVQAAVTKARAAQPAWAAMSFERRAAYMYRVMDIIVADQERVTSRVIAETGKAPGDALSMEVYAALDSLNYYARRAEKFLATEKTRPHGPMGLAKQVRIVYKPMGVVGIIVPWNGPFILALNPAVQALMAGNTVLLKGSEVTPRSTQLVEEIFREAGLPDGVLQVLMGDGETGATLIESGVDPREVVDGADQQTRANDEHHCQGDFSNDKRTPHVMPPTGDASIAVFQRSHMILDPPVRERSEAEEDACYG